MNQDAAITAERVRILNGRAPSSIIALLVTVFIVAYLFREQIASPVLLAWLGSMCILMLVRYWLLVDYKKNREIIPGHEKFENRAAFVVGAVGIGWAIFMVLALTLPAFEYRLYSLLLLTSLVAISVPILSISAKAMHFYIAPPLIVSIALLLSRGGNDTLLGFALIVFATHLIRSGKSAHNTLTEMIALRYKAEALADDLKKSDHDKSSTEHRMQGILDHAPAVIYIRDIDGHFTLVNQQVANLHHMRREDLLGKTLHDVFPKGVADAIRQNDVDVINAGHPLEYEESAPQDDGVHHFVSIKFPLFDETGKVNAVGGVATDITERVRAEESLRISQQRLLLHREQSPVGVIEWNTDFEFLDWNPAAQRIFGFTKKEVIGHHITDTILPDSARPAVDKIWSDLLANKGGAHSINENITKDGRTILCEWHNTPLVDDDGKVIGVASLVDDITTRQKNEEDLRHSQKMDAIGNLTGGIAHDFNNMLNVILGFSALLKHYVGNDDPKIAEYNNQITNAGERAKKLTATLLDFSRKAPSAAETTDINRLLHGMRHMLETTLTARVKLVFELEENLWPVWLDPARLEDAILNICINAMHAMPGGGSLTLTTHNMRVKCSDNYDLDIVPGDYVLFSLQDTGIGMTKEVQQRIFDPFYTTKGGQGTGLGMSQVYGFVQQSGGNIRVQSEPGKSTRISLYMPRFQESDVDSPDDKIFEPVETPMGQETVLVVDDEAAIRDLSEEILSTHGYEVLCVESAYHALEVLDRETVDLMLTDVIMPDMDGYQLATEVKRYYPNIKIQMISGFSEEPHIDEATSTLYQRRLHKPFSPENLLVQVRNALDEENGY